MYGHSTYIHTKRERPYGTLRERKREGGGVRSASYQTGRTEENDYDEVELKLDVNFSK